ncbi:MAG: hypothetical protein ACFE0J_07820 [Elainellaceae cyanobacterium]
MTHISTQNTTVATPASRLNVISQSSPSEPEELTFDLAGRFMNSVGEPCLSGGRFLGTFSYNRQAVDQVPFLPNFGRYELSNWIFKFFDARDRLVGTMSSVKHPSASSASLNRQVIAVVRPACIFLRIDTNFHSSWGSPDWTLRLLFSLPNDDGFLPSDLTSSTFVSGETRPIRADANMPVPTGERVAVANATIQLKELCMEPTTRLKTGS